MKEYRVVYDYKNYQTEKVYTIEAGQNGWIPSKGIAERILRNKKRRAYFRNTFLYLEEREVDSINKENCRIYGGKVVYNQDWLYFDALEIGDYVEAKVVADLMDMLPPACMRSDCSQIGEAANHKLDERDGKVKAVYSTFKVVNGGVWEYCGECFRGENVEHGKEILYV